MKEIENTFVESIIGFYTNYIEKEEKDLFKGESLTPSQFNILGEVKLNNGLKINKLKENLIISRPALSQTLNRMEKAGFITRSIGREDKREILIKPTKLGIQNYDRLNEKYINYTKHRLQNTNKSDLEQVVKLLVKIKESL